VRGLPAKTKRSDGAIQPNSRNEHADHQLIVWTLNFSEQRNVAKSVDAGLKLEGPCVEEQQELHDLLIKFLTLWQQEGTFQILISPDAVN
jgi:hypothetical protein